MPPRLLYYVLSLLKFVGNCSVTKLPCHYQGLDQVVMSISTYDPNSDIFQHLLFEKKRSVFFFYCKFFHVWQTLTWFIHKQTNKQTILNFNREGFL